MNELVLKMRFSPGGEALSNDELLREGQRLFAYYREGQAYSEQLRDRRGHLARFRILEADDPKCADLVAHIEASREAAHAIEARFGLAEGLSWAPQEGRAAL